MNTPSHEEISRHAWQLWQNLGCPAGRDTAIWLEAELSLRDGPGVDDSSAKAGAETAAEYEVEYHLSPAQTEQKSILAAMQKDFARAPQVPHQNAPKAVPSETGKPLWSRPHSS
jgi:hypothetical protein